MLKKIMTLMLALLMTFVLFVPTFAEGTATGADLVEEEEVITNADLTEEEETTSIIKEVVINPERVMDYSKKYHLATVTLGECSKVKWYLLKEDGSLFNGGAEVEHHDAILKIVWNALDINGKHPAGAWNAPVSLRLSLVIIATGINGEEEYAAGWFTYSWYDSENAPAATNNTPAPSSNGSTTTSQSSDVPHTGL